jgi:hypothetical protein
VIVPRWSGVLVPDDTTAALARLNLTPDDLHDPHAVERRLASDRIPAHASEAVASLRESIARDLAGLDGALAPGVVDGMRGQFEKRIEQLERRLRAAARHREQNVFRTVAAARAVLHPLGKPQERVLNGVPLWSRFGDTFIECARAQAATHAHRLVAGAAVTA